MTLFPLTQSHRGHCEQNEQVPPEKTFEAFPADGADPLPHAACSLLHGSAKTPPELNFVRQRWFFCVLV